jgi:glutamate-1-semialdehyde 2,1-aminomutase
LTTVVKANKDWSKSRQSLERARRSLVGGVSSPFRARVSVPLYIEGGQGSRIVDADNNSYIDYALAWGPLILGHSYPELCEAVAAKAKGSHTYGAQHEDEYIVAEHVQALVPCAERVAFTSSGTEAVQLVLRLARAATGRNRILKFEGHYHGWVDSVLISYHPPAGQIGPEDAPRAVLTSGGQVPNSKDNIAVAIWNDVEALERVFERYPGEIAAVIMEPVLCNSGCLLPRTGYLEKVREITRKHGALLIFDEVITGFRQDLGGAQSVYGVTPDLATLGKAIAGGAALSAVVGAKEILEQIVEGEVSFGGTFNGNPLAMAAARVTLRALKGTAGSESPLDRANRLGRQLMELMREAARRRGVALTVCGFGAAFALHFTERKRLTQYRDTLEDDAKKLERFLYRMLEAGIYTLPDGRFYVSTAHSEDDIARTGEIISSIFAGVEFQS